MRAKIESIPDQFFENNTIEELKKFSPKQLNDLGRIASPLYKKQGAQSYSVISYKDAINLIGKKLKQTDPNKGFFYASGRSSNEAALILQIFARVYGCNHIINCYNYCHKASGLALASTIGTGPSTIRYEDLKKADLIFVLGANPASNHPRFIQELSEHRKKGGEVIVINPSFESSLEELASPTHYCQVHVGGDTALLTGISKYLIENQHCNMNFLEDICEDYESYFKFVRSVSWEKIIKISGIEINEIEKISSIYLNSKNTVFTWGMGLTHHINGTDNIESISNLALLRGMVGEEGKGLLPLRWHDNVENVGFMGISEELKSKILKLIEQRYKLSLPKYQGMDTLTCIQAAARGEIEFAFLLGGNLFSVNPDSDFSESALSSIPFKVMINSTLNQTNLNGIEGENIVLPFRIQDNEREKGNFINSEIEIMSDLATKVINKELIDFGVFREDKNIRRALSKLLPGIDDIENIETDKKQFHIGGNYLLKPEFNTDSGKAIFKIPKNTEWEPKDQMGSFKLTSVRSEGQFNTMIYDEKDTHRNQTKRNVLYINPNDIQLLGLSSGDIVDVRSETGVMKGLILAEYNIKPGNVMTFMPEANILIPQYADKRSRTPSFKSVSVTIKNH